MLGLQVKAFALLVGLLLLVDAVAFQGQYRGVVGGKLGNFLSAISPTRWSAGGGRDWSAPGRPRR